MERACAAELSATDRRVVWPDSEQRRVLHLLPQRLHPLRLLRAGAAGDDPLVHHAACEEAAGGGDVQVRGRAERTGDVVQTRWEIRGLDPQFTSEICINHPNVTGLGTLHRNSFLQHLKGARVGRG